MVQPVEGKTKLEVDARGLRLLEQIREPVSPVVVIGPYRSGKSFLLNQLLGVGCGTLSTFGKDCATPTPPPLPFVPTPPLLIHTRSESKGTQNDKTVFAWFFSTTRLEKVHVFPRCCTGCPKLLNASEHVMQ